MTFYESLKIALNSIKNHKISTFFTLIGIIIGTFTMFIVLSLGSEFNNYIGNIFSDFGANTIEIEPISDKSNLDIIGKSEFNELRTTLDCVKSSTPFIAKEGRILPLNKTASVFSGNEDLNDVWGKKILFGNFYTEGDCLQSKKVAVITSNTATNIFGYEDCLGETFEIVIDGTILKLVVCGIVENRSMSAWNVDKTSNIIFTPITMLEKQLGDFSKITKYYVLSTKIFENNTTIDNIKYFLNIRHSDIQDSYKFSLAVENSDMLFMIIRGAVLFALIVVSVSFLCGGFGVMNMMIISVTNREKEIAIRKALGARKTIIVTQFVLESVIMCIIGSLIGLIAGIICIFLLNVIIEIKITFSISMFIVPIIFSILIGIVFGAYPANKAASVYPMNIMLNKR